MVDYKNIRLELQKLLDSYIAINEANKITWEEVQKNNSMENREAMHFAYDLTWLQHVINYLTKLVELASAYEERQIQTLENYNEQLENYNYLKEYWESHTQNGIATDNSEETALNLKKWQTYADFFSRTKDYETRKAERDLIFDKYKKLLEPIEFEIYMWVKGNEDAYLGQLKSEVDQLKINIKWAEDAQQVRYTKSRAGWLQNAYDELNYKNGMYSYLSNSKEEQKQQIENALLTAKDNLRYLEIAMVVDPDDDTHIQVMAQDKLVADYERQLKEFNDFGGVLDYLPNRDFLRSKLIPLQDQKNALIAERNSYLKQISNWEEFLWEEIQEHIRAKEKIDEIIKYRESQALVHQNIINTSGNNDQIQMSINLRDDIYQDIIALYENLYDDLEEDLEEKDAFDVLDEKILTDFVKERKEVHKKDLEETLIELENVLAGQEQNLRKIYQDRHQILDSKRQMLELQEKEKLDRQFEIIKNKIDNVIDSKIQELTNIIDEITNKIRAKGYNI